MKLIKDISQEKNTKGRMKMLRNYNLFYKKEQEDP